MPKRILKGQVVNNTADKTVNVLVNTRVLHPIYKKYINSSEKFLAHDKKSVGILKSKEAMVTTFPVKTWRELLEQRTRWAAKTSQLKSVPVQLIGLLVTLVNLFLILSFLRLAFQPNSHHRMRTFIRFMYSKNNKIPI